MAVLAALPFGGLHTALGGSERTRPTCGLAERHHARLSGPMMEGKVGLRPVPHTRDDDTASGRCITLTPYRQRGSADSGNGSLVAAALAVPD